MRRTRAADCLLDGVSHRFEGDANAVVSESSRYRIAHRDDGVDLWCDGSWKRSAVASTVSATRADDRAGEGGDHIVADLPGVVTQVLVVAGGAVTAGTPVVVVEAMKLFHTLTAPRDGTIAAVAVAVGATVDRGTILVALVPVVAA